MVNLASLNTHKLFPHSARHRAHTIRACGDMDVSTQVPNSVYRADHSGRPYWQR